MANKNAPHLYTTVAIMKCKTEKIRDLLGAVLRHGSLAAIGAGSSIGNLFVQYVGKTTIKVLLPNARKEFK